MSQLLHEAEQSIKDSVNAGPAGRTIACGTGATGAIDKLQQLIGVALPPATRKNICDRLSTPDSKVTCKDIEQAMMVASTIVPLLTFRPFSSTFQLRIKRLDHFAQITPRNDLIQIQQKRLPTRLLAKTFESIIGERSLTHYDRLRAASDALYYEPFFELIRASLRVLSARLWPAALRGLKEKSRPIERDCHFAPKKHYVNTLSRRESRNELLGKC